MKASIKNENTNTFEIKQKSEITDFRLYLQDELVSRGQKNSSYSLRSFARTLGLDPSSLSQILRGKRKLAPKSIEKLAQRLGLGPDEIAKFKTAPGILNPIPSRYELTLDVFKVIADWYHFAIFELVTVRNFQPDPKWISKSLGITVSEAHSAIERLQRLDLIVIDNKGKWKQGNDLITTTGNSFTTTAFRKLQRGVLEKALLALEEMPIEIRDQTSMTMAINSKRIPEIKEKIKKFRRQLCEDLQKDKVRDSVYNLGVSFYPLTRFEKE